MDTFRRLLSESKDYKPFLLTPFSFQFSNSPGPWRDSSVLALSLGPQLGVILTAACALYSELHYAPWRARRLAGKPLLTEEDFV